MDLKAYISSGIIEDHLLGLTTEQESREIACLSKIYPEIREEIEKTAAALEQYALQYAQAPDERLKAKILDKIAETPQDKNDAKIIPLQKNHSKTKKSGNDGGSAGNVLIKFWAAASVLIIIGLAIYNHRQSNTFGSYQNQISQLVIENQQLQEDYSSISALNNKANAELSMYSNPNIQTVFLKGIKGKSQDNLAIVCWNKVNKKIKICVKSLPQAPKGKAYQLWAIENGKPKSMGVLNMKKVQGSFAAQNAKAEQPEAFAITLEKTGGATTPTLSAMYVLGKV